MPNEIDRESLLDLKAELKVEIQRIAEVQVHQYEKIDSKLDRMNSALIKTEAKHLQQEKQLDQIEHIINGNGKPGLKADVQHLSQCMDRFDSDITELKATVSEGFAAIYTRQKEHDKREDDLKESIRVTRTKIAVALIGSAGLGGAVLKIVQLLIL